MLQVNDEVLEQNGPEGITVVDMSNDMVNENEIVGKVKMLYKKIM